MEPDDTACERTVRQPMPPNACTAKAGSSSISVKTEVNVMKAAAPLSGPSQARAAVGAEVDAPPLARMPGMKDRAVNAAESHTSRWVRDVVVSGVRSLSTWESDSLSLVPTERTALPADEVPSRKEARTSLNPFASGIDEPLLRKSNLGLEVKLVNDRKLECDALKLLPFEHDETLQLQLVEVPMIGGKGITQYALTGRVHVGKV